MALPSDETPLMKRVKMNVPVPSGEGEICVITGVEDGGKFMKASGFLVCG